MATCAAIILLLAAVRAAPATHDAEIAAWRHARETRLRSEDGWLAIVGLFWLSPGANRFGSDAGNEVVLPAGAPGRAGVLRLEKETVTVFPESGAPVAVAGTAISDARALADDTPGPADIVSVGRVKFHVIQRGPRLGVRVRDPESPRRRDFPGLDWYPVDPRYRVTGRFVPHLAPRRLAFVDVLGNESSMPSPGVVTFRLGGRDLALTAAYEEPGTEELYFMFKDTTNNRATYGGGRQLYAAPAKDGTVVLDFNKAYNFPCALSPYTTCPIPPRENHLPIAIQAGEKTPPGAKE